VPLLVYRGRHVAQIGNAAAQYALPRTHHVGAVTQEAAVILEHQRAALHLLGRGGARRRLGDGHLADGVDRNLPKRWLCRGFLRKPLAQTSANH
jgi:hypothetical protein